MKHFIIASWEPELKQKCLYRLPPRPIIPFNMRFPDYKKEREERQAKAALIYIWEAPLCALFMCSIILSVKGQKCRGHRVRLDMWPFQWVIIKPPRERFHLFHSPLIYLSVSLSHSLPQRDMSIIRKIRSIAKTSEGIIIQVAFSFVIFTKVTALLIRLDLVWFEDVCKFPTPQYVMMCQGV